MTSVAGPPYPPAARRLGPRAYDRSRELWVRKTGSCRRYPSRRPANRAASRRVISGHFRCRGSDKFKLGLVPRKITNQTQLEPKAEKWRQKVNQETFGFEFRTSAFFRVSTFGLRIYFLSLLLNELVPCPEACCFSNSDIRSRMASGLGECCKTSLRYSSARVRLPVFSS